MWRFMRGIVALRAAVTRAKARFHFLAYAALKRRSSTVLQAVGIKNKELRSKAKLKAADRSVRSTRAPRCAWMGSRGGCRHTSNLESEVGFVVEEAVFVADYDQVGPGWGGGDQETQGFGIDVGREVER
jgi:hypothetical protein